MSKEKFICKVCEKEVIQIRSVIKKSASMKSGCCSLSCFKKTNDYFVKRKNGDKKRIEKIRETGSFIENGTKSKLTRAKKFLHLHNINYENLNDNEIIDLWKSEFSIRTEHGEKVKKGRIKKHKTIEKLREADKERVLKGACKKLGIQYSQNMDESVKKSITLEAFQNFKVKNSLSWKALHILRHTEIGSISNLNDDMINNLYSEYISRRFTRSSIETTKNGYTNSEKGWYKMINQYNESFFYRSSWELKVFEALDILVGMKKVSYVFTPDRIQYEIDGIKRHYYPDVAFCNLHNEKIVIEVKPFKKINEITNKLKIAAAKDKFGKRFHVLTENEIFNYDLLKILGEM